MRQLTAAHNKLVQLIPRITVTAPVAGIMASKGAHALPSNPEYLLSLISEIGDETDSDEEFDGG